MASRLVPESSQKYKITLENFHIVIPYHEYFPLLELLSEALVKFQQELSFLQFEYGQFHGSENHQYFYSHLDKCIDLICTTVALQHYKAKVIAAIKIQHRQTATRLKIVTFDTV